MEQGKNFESAEPMDTSTEDGESSDVSPENPKKKMKYSNENEQQPSSSHSATEMNPQPQLATPPRLHYPPRSDFHVCLCRLGFICENCIARRRGENTGSPKNRRSKHG